MASSPPSSAVGADHPAVRPSWPLWQRVLFRFFAIYLVLQVAPWNWVARIPGLQGVTTPYRSLLNATVEWSNARLFHVRDVLVMPNGSGDTSWSWAQLWLFLLVAAVGTVLWSVFDRRRPHYARAGYWLRTIVRYYIATYALGYGIIKIFALQMTFPSLSQMATPLGDLLPMRLSWLFIGYSAPYQVFSGVAETMAGLLLLPRRTVTLGVLAAAGAFLNVLMINLGYDVPVKIFAAHLLLACLFLLAQDAPRLLAFLALNQGAGPTTLYDPPYPGPRFRYARLAAKAVMIVLIVVLPFVSGWQGARARAVVVAATPLDVGVYDVRRFVVNGDTIPALPNDTLRWRDVIIDSHQQGSVGTSDAAFWQRYRRGYFRFKGDTVARTLAVWRTSFLFDSTHVFTARYERPDSVSARLWTTFRGDSLYVELVKTPRHFQLSERQFHWLSEYNR